MKLEQQVTSLELSKRLKELGVRSPSLFAWDKEGTIQNGSFHPEPEDKNKYENRVAAYIVAELLDIAPAGTSILKRTDLETKKIPMYFAETPDHYRYQDSAPTASEALGLMLEYLIKNNLLTV